MRIFIFGDSITQGFYDTQGGWATRLANKLHSTTLENMLAGNDKNEYEVFNLGVSGDTAGGVLERMDAEIAARQLGKDEDVIVIAVGCNDSLLRENHVFVDEDVFLKTVEDLVDKAVKHTSRVLLVGLAPVDQSLTDPWKFSSSGKQYKNNRIDLFEDTLKRVAERKNIGFVPIYDTYKAELDKGTKLHADGLHPNDKGHELIAELVKPKLKELVA